MNRHLKNWKWLGMLLLLIVINVIAASFHYRFDLTEEDRYSLTSPTKQLVDSLQTPLEISVFLSGDIPAEFRRLASATQDFLLELRDVNPAMVSYKFIDPLEEVVPGKSWADSLQSLGATPINVSVQQKAGQETKVLFPYAVLSLGDKRALVNLFQTSKRFPTIAELNSAEAMMEYQFARQIDQLVHREVPAVAYAVGNGQPTGPETYDLQQTVGAHYNLGLFNLKTQKSIPSEINVLLIVKPTERFTDEEKLKLDQFVMQGGKILWFIDNLNAEQDSLSIKSQLIAYERGLNLEDLLFNYGVRLNPDLIMDLQSDFLPFVVGGSRTDPQYEFLKWNYYPLFESRNNHQINKNLGLVAGKYVNSIDTIERSGLVKTFLLQSSNNSRTISTPALISPNENRNAPTDISFQQSGIPAAVLVEGSFTSLYKNRLSRAQADSLAGVGGFKEKSPEGKMIVVADGDMVLNDISQKQGPLPMGMNYFTLGTQYEYQFANREFLLNSLEYLTGKPAIIETRNKEIVLRMLDVKKVNDEMIKWQMINIAVPILLMVIFGLVYQQLRRRRYAS